MNHEQLTSALDTAHSSVKEIWSAMMSPKGIDADPDKVASSIFVLKLQVDMLHARALLIRKEQKSKVRRYQLANQNKKK